MARIRIVYDLATGEQTEVPYTPDEEAEADAAYEAEQAALAAVEEPRPLEKLVAFLDANPDVRALLD